MSVINAIISPSAPYPGSHQVTSVTELLAACHLGRLFDLRIENQRTMGLKLNLKLRLCILIASVNQKRWSIIETVKAQSVAHTTQQHRVFCPFCPGCPWQLSLNLFCKRLNRHGRITSCFSYHINMNAYKAPNLLQQPINARFSQFVGSPHRNSVFLGNETAASDLSTAH